LNDKSQTNTGTTLCDTIIAEIATMHNF